MTELEFKQFIFSEACDISSTALLLLVYIKMQSRERYVFYNSDIMTSLKIKDVRTLRAAKDELIKKGHIRQILSGRGYKFVIPKLDEPNTKNVLGTNSEPNTKNVLGTNSEPNTKNVSGTNSEPSTKNVLGTNSEPSTKNVSDTKNAPSTFFADDLVHFLQKPSAFFAENRDKKCTTKINNKETIKETNKGISDSEKPAEQIGESQQETTSSSLSLDNLKNENEKTEAHVKTEPKYKTEKYSELQDINEMDRDTQDALAFLRERFA